MQQLFLIPKIVVFLLVSQLYKVRPSLFLFIHKYHHKSSWNPFDYLLFVFSIIQVNDHAVKMSNWWNFCFEKVDTQLFC